MSNLAEEGRLPTDLVAAFTEMGPAWGRWVQACLPDDTASYARLRVLTALECDGDRTMKQLAEALEVTPRRITVLVDALEEHGLAERYAHPTDGRSTLVAITQAGLEAQRLGWQQHQDKVAVAFADLPADDQRRLLAISRDLTAIFRKRLAGEPSSTAAACAPGRDAARMLAKRRRAAARSDRGR
jgi:DNA-binding MarR family transcriptional regulator